MESIQITGLREVQQRLYSYSQKLGDRVVIGALRQGANLVKRQVVSQVPVKTGKLRRGFKVALSRIHRGRMSGDMIGVYLTLRKGKDAPYYGRFINDGWNTKSGRATYYSRLNTFQSMRRTVRQRAFAGRAIPGKHFIQNAFASQKENAVRLIVQASQAGADVLAKKMGL